MRVITGNAQALKALREDCEMWANSKRLRLDELNNELNLLGFNISRNYKGKTQKGYAIANHNQLDEFDQPTINYADTLAGCASKIGQWVKGVLSTEEETKESYLSDPASYPKLGNIPNVHNRYCFYQEYHKLERLAEDKGLDLTNWFDDENNYWSTYPDNPECSIVVWGEKATRIYISEDNKWLKYYQNITFEPSDRGLKQLKEFIENYNPNLEYAYCEECTLDCFPEELKAGKCAYCDSDRVKSGRARFDDDCVYYASANDNPFCFSCFQKYPDLNVMSDAISNIWDDALSCECCNKVISAIAYPGTVTTTEKKDQKVYCN